MSDNELDELLLQLKETCKKNRHHSSTENNLNTILKKLDVFINRRQMKLLNHQKRLDDLQRDLVFSECESSRNRAELEKKDFEVNQLHMMLDKAEQTTQNIMQKYDNDVQKLNKQLSNIQQEYERLQTIHKNKQENRTNTGTLTKIGQLQELNKMLEIDNQRLYNENDQLKQSQQSKFKLKIKTLENDIEVYKHRSEQQEKEITRLKKELNAKNSSNELNQMQLLLTNSEQQCNSLRLELQRLQTEKEILRVKLLEQKMTESTTSDFKDIENNNSDYEKFIRNELEVNIDQANKLINYWNSHKKTLEEKIRQLTDEIYELKRHNKTNNDNDRSIEIFKYNEAILESKRDINKLQMEITDKNTIIYNLYKKIECLEQALMISKQRMNAQLNEIQDLRSRNSKPIPLFMDTDDEGQIRQSLELNKNLCTSSPIKSADIHKYFRHFDSDSTPSMDYLHQYK